MARYTDFRSPHNRYNSNIMRMPPLANMSVEALPEPPPRAPRLDLTDLTLGSMDRARSYDRYARRTPRWRSPLLRHAYNPNVGRHGRGGARYRLVHDLTAFQPGYFLTYQRLTVSQSG